MNKAEALMYVHTQGQVTTMTVEMARRSIEHVNAVQGTFMYTVQGHPN